MSAPLKNKNHLKYPPVEVKRIFRKAIEALKNDEQLFNYPSLHRAIGLETLRTLPYLAEKYSGNKQIMKLWHSLQAELEKNQQKHIELYHNN